MGGSLSRRAIFLDRDGTLNVRPPAHQYVGSADDFVWLDGTREAIREIVDLGYPVAVVSNQRGVGRGLVEAAAIEEIESVMQADLRDLGCSVAAFRYCFHLESDACSCRKPAPGLILDAAAELAIDDLAGSWMVGDAETDVKAGRAAGCRTALISAGAVDSAADMIVASLGEFARALAAGADLSPSGG